MTHNKLRLNSLQWVRAIAALTVVFYHIAVIAHTRSDITYLNNVFKYGHLGVDLFFVLSGFIIYYVHEKDLGKVSSVKKYYLKRFFRIWPLVCIFTTLKLCFGLGLGAETFGENQMNPQVVIASYLLFPVSSELGGVPLISVAWTLAHEMQFYLIFGFSLIFGEKFLKLLSIIWLFLIVIYASVKTTNCTALDFTLSAHNIEFIYGLFVAHLFMKFHAVKRPIAFLILIFGLGMLCYAISFKEPAEWPLILSTFYFGFSFSLILFALITLERAGFMFRGIGIFLGNSSYSIYLLHSSIQVLCWVISIKLCANFNLDLKDSEAFSSQAILSLIGVISIFGGIACYLFIEKPLTKFISKKINKRPELNELNNKKAE